jgi:hypothetical protein
MKEEWGYQAENEPLVTYVWTMKNGKKIKLHDMTRSHLLNALRVVENGSRNKDTVFAIKEELRKRERDE